ncbi:MAG: nicotinamide-nucleotide amidohydrolase family protein [Gemmatimonadota bacterium]
MITIGDELLLGQTIDTNAAFLSEQLAAAGLRVLRRTTVGDDADAIAAAVSEALARKSIVITTGGLGPTRDDFTKPVIARLYGRETAPGLVLDDARGITIMLPGVPHELRDLAVREVIPFLLERTRQRAHPICYRVVRVTGVPESALAERIDDIVDAIAPLSVAFLPGFAGIDLRITSWALFDLAECEARFSAAEQRLRERLGSHIYAVGSDDIEVVAGRLLSERKLQLAVAESCTGGLLGQRITRVAGSSDYFIGGFIAYANDAKVDMLGVRLETLTATGAVSEETAREMALGAAARTGANAAISITGIAGPGGGSPDKPVGLVWTAVFLNDVVRTRSFVFPGDRAEIRERSAQMALALLYDMLIAS